uniref:Uncharacterized protein n=1 Tax=Timema douglasi TaxID=61478 RepID=A0A7R8Z798_TIMDO|nr:unnamed protein product [Timema douglasi]
MKGAKLMIPLRRLHFTCHLDGENSNLAVTLLLLLSFLNSLSSSATRFFKVLSTAVYHVIRGIPGSLSDSNKINFSLCSCHLLSLRELAIYLKLT